MSEITGTRRLVGIDLGVRSEHTVVMLDEGGRVLGRRKCRPTRESLAEVERAALSGAPEGLRLEVVMEPTGGAWLPVASFFKRRGHRVHRVSSATSHDGRRFLRRHAKTNQIDAQALARLPLMMIGEELQELELPGATHASQLRRVKAMATLTDQLSAGQTRLRDLVSQLLPMSPLKENIGNADLVVLETTGADPEALRALGEERLTALLGTASRSHQGRGRALEWLTAAEQALDLLGEEPTWARVDRTVEIKCQVEQLRLFSAQFERHREAAEQAHRESDPEQLARSLPGIGELGGPVMAAYLADPGRFQSGRQFRSFTGLLPAADETGDTDRKGRPMSKAGPGPLRKALYLAADHARRQDPQLAEIYYQQIVEKGAVHTKAVNVVASHLAVRLWSVMSRGKPYQLRDNQRQPITAEAARALIAEKSTVGEEVRQQRRGLKHRKGKAPHQVLAGHAKAGAPGAATTRRPLPPASSAEQAANVKPVAGFVPLAVLLPQTLERIEEARHGRR